MRSLLSNIQLVMAVVFLFALCWLPIHVIMVLRALRLYVNTPVAITIQVKWNLKLGIEKTFCKIIERHVFALKMRPFFSDYKSYFSILKFMCKSNFIRISIGTISSRFLVHHHMYPTFRSTWNSTQWL